MQKRIALLLLVLVLVVMFSTGKLYGFRLLNTAKKVVNPVETTCKVVKGVTLLTLTSMLSDELNTFINTITLNKNIPGQAETKVVNIVAMDSGIYIGAAQVTGPRELVESVKAVIQIDTKFLKKNLGVEIFIPSDSMNPLEFNRVEGVGVTALINLRVTGS